MKKITVVLFVFSLLLGCAKWVSEDISKKEITLISPSPNQSDSIQNKTFKWEELKGADKYRLQIVTPRFDSVLNFEVDIKDTALSYSLPLSPGKYEWRVRGENSDFESKWTTRNFFISSTASLSGQTISGISPITGTNSNILAHTFKWNSLLSAEYYSVIIQDNDDQQINIGNTTSTNYSYTFPSEGKHSVIIQAINSISASISAKVDVLIDTTMPSTPTLLYPVLDTIFSFPKDFKWENEANEGSVITETLMIASDSLMNNILFDTTFVKNSPISLDTIKAGGKLYWKIDRTDAAGNTNNNSLSKRFYIY